MSPGPTEAGANPTFAGVLRDRGEATPWGFFGFFSLRVFNALMLQNLGSTATPPILGFLGHLALWGDLESLKSRPGFCGDAGDSSFPPVPFPCSVPRA